MGLYELRSYAIRDCAARDMRIVDYRTIANEVLVTAADAHGVRRVVRYATDRDGNIERTEGKEARWII